MNKVTQDGIHSVAGTGFTILLRHFVLSAKAWSVSQLYSTVQAKSAWLIPTWESE